MATTGHESEAINVQGLKASLQKFKTDKVDGKADKVTVTAGSYNKVTVNSQGVVTAGDNPTTLAGHGITDAYTKGETYNKTEVNGLVDTPHQNYVTVQATAQTTDATDVLPASGQAADTIYRVSNWDGSANSFAGAFDVTKYSEYAWDDQSNPNKYVFLCVKTAIGEVFDISVYNNNATYPDLASALGTNGANVPETLRKGGMSVKFVHSVDNKYVQYRLMADEWSIDTEDWAIAEEGVYVENPEFVYVKTDKECKILWAIKTNGSIYYGAGVPQQVIDYIEEKISSLSLDEYEDIVAFLNDYLGSDTTLKAMIDGINNSITNLSAVKVDKEEGKSIIDAEYASTKSTVDNPEFLEVTTDSEGKLLAGRTLDGAAFENVGLSTSKVSIDGVNFETIFDPENRMEVGIDGEKKIINYRDKNGVLHEGIGIETPAVNTNSLNLTAEGMSDFQQALKNAGFLPGGGGDASDREDIELPEPKSCGLLNLVIPNLPTQNSVVGQAQYYDFYGNSFKLNCEVSPQGQTSMIFSRTGGKGNYTLDLEKDVKFGSWVPQDSFHLKGCAKDVTRGFLSTSYKLAYLMMQALDAKPNRVLVDESGITTIAASGSRMNDWPNEARCLPDGFPVEIYINGEYWGLYSWQLKKHRKNYSMDKKDYKSFFLDADGSMQDFWNGNINWTMFEIKNPKDLICMDGSAYDGDNPQELIDETAVGIYDATNKKHTGSKQTKDIIKSFSTKYLEVKALVDANTPESLAEAKTKFADYFDVNASILVYIFNPIMANSDSVNKNTLWGTYNNGKIVPMLWDLDSVYGEPWDGIFARTPDASMFNGQYATATWPLALLWKLYKDEIKAAYKELRDDGIISMDTWRNVVYNQWVNRIGQTAYERDIKKWPETPSYRENYTNSEYWQEVERNIAVTVENAWSESTQYNVGDTACLKMYPTESIGIKYRAIQANINVCPVTKFYTGFPQVGGYYNSPKRMEKWMETQIQLCDIELEYNNN